MILGETIKKPHNKKVLLYSEGVQPMPHHGGTAKELEILDSSWQCASMWEAPSCWLSQSDCTPAPLVQPVYCQCIIFCFKIGVVQSCISKRSYYIYIIWADFALQKFKLIYFVWADLNHLLHDYGELSQLFSDMFFQNSNIIPKS